MGSMNWLGFSLSPQHVQAAAAAAAADPSISEEGNDHHHDIDQSTTCTALVSRLGFNYSDEISGTDVSSADCFDLMTTSDHHNTIDHDDSATTTTAPNDNNSHHSLYGHLPPSFGMLHQATFNTNNNNIHSQVGGGDWNMKSSSDRSNYYKMSSSNSTSSDHHMQLSMLMGTTNDSCMLDHQNHHQQPKLENFLGRHSFADHHQDHMIETASTISSTPHAAYNNNSNNNINNNNSSSNIGLSMIKTWLRNQPAPPHQQEKKKDINVQTGSLSLSMTSTSGSLRTHTTSSAAAASAGGETCSSDGENNKQAIITATPSGIGSSQINTSSATAAAAIEAVPRKSIDTFGQRTSIYRGVTRHRWTGRYEAHLWDNSCRREGQTRKGRQVYLGGYDKEEKAARAYDLAALKYWGTTTTTNFPISTYEKEVDEMKHMTRQEYVASLRRKSSGFSRGASMYRGVTRHHQHGRWQARIGRVAGNKDLYLGTFGTQEEAAEAYDIAAIKFRGLNAVTNFDMSRYDVKSILESSTLPIGGAAKRLKDVDHHRHQEMTLLVDHGNNRSSSTLTDHDNMMMMHGSTSTTAACHENDHHQQQLMMSSSTTSTDHHNSGGGGGGGGWPTTLALINQQAAAAAAHHHHHNYHHGIGMQYYYSPSSPSSPSSYGQRVWCKQEQDTTSSTQSFYQQQQQQDHQLPQLGSSHNFFQPAAISAAAGLNMNLMTRTSTDSLEHSSGSNSVIYGTSTAATGEGGGSDHHGGYIIPMATCVDVINNGYEDGSENVYGSSTTSGTSTTRDHQHAYNPARNHLYYLPVLPLVHGPQSSSLSSVGVVNDHDQDNQQGQAAAGSSSAYNNCNWVPTAVPTNNINMAPAALFHGTSSTPTFTVWNDT